MRWFSNLSVCRKAMAIVAVAFVGLALVSALAVHAMDVKQLTGRKARLQENVEIAIAVIGRHAAEAASGRTSEAQAKADALDDLRAIHYGTDGYFWVNDDTTVLVQPAFAEFEGKPIDSIVTPSGVHLLTDMLAIARKDGSGFYPYSWMRPNAKVAEPKLSYVTAYAPWGWVVGTGLYMDDLAADLRAEALHFGFLVLIVTALVGAVSVYVARKISRPLAFLTADMKVMADGKLDIELPAVDRRDEVGAMSRALQVFQQGLLRERAHVERQKAEEVTKEKAAQAQTRLVDDFGGKVVEVIETVFESAEFLETNAKAMAATFDRTGQMADHAATGSEEAATNVQTVAAASEQLAASSREIASQVTRASAIARNAATEANTTNNLVTKMADAANRIGDVVKLINAIATQTNLLALNATIEAARAGEAGKGFAVVANEVKNLANQTAKATDEISAHIADVQQKTAQSVAAIGAISTTIQEMDEVSGAIAAAVEEQGAATQEITRNIQKTHTGTAEVAENVKGVSQGVQTATDAAKNVLKSARHLNQEAESLRGVADKFMIQLQTAGATLEWGPAWLTGNSVIDADHKMLVQYVNDLNRAMLEGHGHDVAADTLNKLVQYTRDHFAREEVIWQQGGLESLAEHNKTHVNLVTQVTAFQKDFLAGKAALTGDLMTFLRNWLIGHVFKTDKAGVAEINARKREAASTALRRAA